MHGGPGEHIGFNRKAAFSVLTPKWQILVVEFAEVLRL
jgi:hypothetical protein